MSKISLIVLREFRTRVRKKSFIIMTLLGPVLIVGFYALLIYISVNEQLTNELKKTLVVDESGLFKNQIEENEFYRFEYKLEPLEAARLQLRDEDYFAVLYIPPYAVDSLAGFELIAKSQVSLKDEAYFQQKLEQVIKSKRFADSGIDQRLIMDINKTKITLSSVKDTDKGLESGNSMAATAVGFAAALLIYLFIFIYGVQIMKGVLEEKTNRIVEVIISSVKPFELMMGKILGIAMVALLQFVVWVALTALLGGGIQGVMAMNAGASMPDAQQAGGSGLLTELMSQLANLNIAFIICMFLFYFIGGYLFYGALFAAIGSAVDNDTETQQFMLPITMPLIFAFVLAQSAITTNPDGALAFWLSIIPFTSPIVMMVRIPFLNEGFGWQVLLSMGLMILGIIFTTWIAGRIYRIGILMHGKKVSYKELGKWLFYKG